MASDTVRGKSGTHNAEGTTPLASYRASGQGDATPFQNAHHAVESDPATQVGQRSSVVEHPTHNGKVAGSYPAAGIPLSDDARLTLAATLAVASQDRVAPRVEWALCRVDSGTNALRIAQKCWAPSIADASAQFRRGPYRGYPASWVIVSVAALRTTRRMPLEASA